MPDVAGYGARADVVGLARGQKCLRGTLSSVKFDLMVKWTEWVLAALPSAAIFTSWCGFCCGDVRCRRCPRKPLGFQDGLLPLLLAAMILGFWAFRVDGLSGLSHLSMRSG